MNVQPTRSNRPAWRLALLAATLAAPSAFAASARPAAGQAACTAVRSEARDNCLSEASTRRAGSRPTAAGENPEQLLRNALRRCEPLREPDRQDCVLRIRGAGTTSGSVAAGGIYRELVTVEAGQVPAAAPMPMPAAASAPASTPVAPAR